MHKSMSALIFAGFLGFVSGPAAQAEGMETVLLGNGGWEPFAGTATSGSLAWAGEDETLTGSATGSGVSQFMVEFDEREIDVALLTGLPAPEPPALVLAGMAFGGVLCCRSLLMRRRAKAESSDGAESQG